MRLVLPYYEKANGFPSRFMLIKGLILPVSLKVAAKLLIFPLKIPPGD